jgi:hypothetical protein
MLGVAVLVLTILAAGIVWIYLTNPVAVVNAVNDGDVTPLVRDIARLLAQGLQVLLKYL